MWKAIISHHLSISQESSFTLQTTTPIFPFRHTSFYILVLILAILSFGVIADTQLYLSPALGIFHSLYIYFQTTLPSPFTSHKRSCTSCRFHSLLQVLPLHFSPHSSIQSSLLAHAMPVLNSFLQLVILDYGHHLGFVLECCSRHCTNVT